MSRPKKYQQPKRLSQMWPSWLHEAMDAAAREKGQDATEWLQEVAKSALTRQWSAGRLREFRELEGPPQPA